MELIILLCFAYAVWRASLDAAVEGYAVARGRAVPVGPGARQTRSAGGFALGAALGVFARSLVEGMRVGWPWAQRTAARWQQGRRDGARFTRPWQNMRGQSPRGRQRRPQRQPQQPTRPDAAGQYVDDEDDEDRYHRCVQCHRDLDADDGPPYRYTAEGRVCDSHFHSHCAACGHTARDDDPLILIDGHWEHLSHQPPTPPRPTDGLGEEVVRAADVVDENGRPVDAIWEPAPDRWASLRGDRR